MEPVFCASVTQLQPLSSTGRCRQRKDRQREDGPSWSYLPDDYRWERRETSAAQPHCRVRRYGSSPGDRYTCKKERKAFVYSPSALSVWVLSRQPSQNTVFFSFLFFFFFFFYTLSALTAQAAVVLIECFFREVSRERVSCHSSYGSGSAVTVVMEADFVRSTAYGSDVILLLLWWQAVFVSSVRVKCHTDSAGTHDHFYCAPFPPPPPPQPRLPKRAVNFTCF